VAKPFVPHILYEPRDGGIVWPTLTTGEAGDAVAVFTTAEKAKAFRDAKPDRGLQVGSMPWEEFLRWLRFNLTSGLASCLTVDPDTAPVEGVPGATAFRMIDIFRFLAEAEEWQKPA
jgi:hypothetical protein